MKLWFKFCLWACGDGDPLRLLGPLAVLGAVAYMAYQIGHAIVFSTALREVIK